MKNVESSLFLFLIVALKWFVMKSCSHIFSRLFSWQRAPLFSPSISALTDSFMRIRSFITSELIMWWQDLIICRDASAHGASAGWCLSIGFKIREFECVWRSLWPLCFLVSRLSVKSFPLWEDRKNTQWKFHCNHWLMFMDWTNQWVIFSVLSGQILSAAALSSH